MLIMSKDHELPLLSDIFPFDYKGGGYFRERGVKIGESAQTLHGEKAIEYLYEKMMNILHSNGEKNS